MKNCHDMALTMIYAISISYGIKNFLSTLKENGPCRFGLITSLKIFVYIYEVLSIAP